MENLNIRKAVPADIDGLARCIDAAYARYANSIPDLPAVSEGCAEDIADNQVWVVVEMGEVIAALVLIAQTDFLKLANLAVHPDHGGKGIGRKLADLAENEAKRQGYRELHLNTHIAMQANVQLYRHWGWQEASRSGNTVSMRKSV